MKQDNTTELYSRSCGYAINRQFCHLHLHTQYSLLDGAVKFDRLFKTLKTKNVPSCAITDHGNLFGVVEFYEEALKAGIKPIIGCEAYLAPISRFDRTKSLPGFEKDYHLILLVENEKGWKNLCRLISLAYLEGYYYKPRIDKELLREYHDGLICLSACLQGEIPYLLRHNRYQEAVNAAKMYADIFGEDSFYIEVQANGLKEQKDVNNQLYDLANKLGLSLVATNDCHYVEPGDAKAHDVLLCIQTNRKVSDTNRFKFSTEQLYVKSATEIIKEIGPRFDEAIGNTLNISNRCDFGFNFSKKRFPVYKLRKEEEGKSSEEILQNKAINGLMHKIENKEESAKKKYLDRLHKELEVLINKGFADYFLIVQDFISFAHSQGIMVGPGRGSAAGSLVSYALGITKLDPIKHGLLFERFLNPERLSLPDIDVDFCFLNRDKVLQYVKDRFGENHVAQIITFGTMKAKAAIRDVGRVLGLSFSDTDKIAKLIPAPRQGRDWPLQDAIRIESRLSELAKKDERVKEVLDYALILEDQVRHVSTHAAGVVISGEQLYDYIPLFKMPEGNITTQFSMKYVEKLGYIKFDFLGLKTLTLLMQAKELIKRSRGIGVDIDNLPIEDSKVFELLQKGDTTGVFQLESSGMRNLLVKLKPTTFEDIVAVLALFRPGPLGSGMVDDFIKRKHGLVPIEYPLEELKDVLKETYGIILYQEQVMQIASLLADYTLGEADLLRRAMGKKNPNDMQNQRKRFLDGAIKKGVGKKKASEIFDLMEKFADYGFNKSHSAAYAFISYQCAYLKAHFQKEWMAAIMTIDMGDLDKILKDIYACRQMHVDVLPPHVNESDTSFTVVPEGLRFGLLAIKNVGEKAANNVMEERSKHGLFLSLEDFARRANLQMVNKRVVGSLIKAGALDGLGPSRKHMFDELEDLLGQLSKKRNSRKSQVSLFSMLEENNEEVHVNNGDQSEWSEETKLAFERELVGLYLSGHPLRPYWDKLLKVYGGKPLSLGNMDSSRGILVGGVVTAFSSRTTRKGEKYANLVLEDVLQTYEVIVWPVTFKKYTDLIQKNAKLIIKGRLDAQSEGARKLIATDILNLPKVIDDLARNMAAIYIKIDARKVSSRDLHALRDVLLNTPGSSPLFFQVIDGDFSTICLRPSDSFRVSPYGLSERLEKEFKGSIGVMR